MTMDGVLFAAAEPGGANVLASFHAGAKSRHTVHAAWATPGASPVLEAAGLRVERIDDGLAAPAIERRWASIERPRAVLTGTSLDGTLETALWRLAARDHVPALAWLDQWMNLEHRFRCGRPAWVAALDETQRDALKRMGFEDRQIILGGHPHLHAMLSRPLTVTPREAHDSAQTVLFVSENETPVGYRTEDVFDIVAHGVEAAALDKPYRRIDLVVKFHPLEGAPRPFIDRIEARAWPANVRASWLPGTISGREAAAAADLVVGMSSMLLLEALLMERPVLSLMPGLLVPDPFIATQLGAVYAAHEHDACVDLVRRALVEPDFRAMALERQKCFLGAMPGDGSANVLAWLNAVTVDAVR